MVGGVITYVDYDYAYAYDYDYHTLIMTSEQNANAVKGPALD